MNQLRKAALDFIRPYVDRGDSVESLRLGMGSVSCKGFNVQIGGYLSIPEVEKLQKLRPGTVGVVIGKEWAVFDLAELYTALMLGE